MSQDLLKEFDSLFAAPAPAPAVPPSFPRSNAQASAGRHGHTRSSSVAFQDLRLGTTVQPLPPPRNAAITRLASKPPRPVSFHGSPSPSFFPSTPPASSNPDPFSIFGSISRKPTSNSIPTAQSTHDSNDFGDFPSAMPSPVATPPGRAAVRPPIVAARSSFGELASLSLSSSQPAAAPATHDDDADDFGDFIDSPAVESTPSEFAWPQASGSLVDLPLTGLPHAVSTSSRPDSMTSFPPSQISSSAASSPRTGHKRPQSISLKNSFPTETPSTKVEAVRKVQTQKDHFPPVAILLSAFPPLFGLPQAHLLSKLRGVPYPLRQRVLADPRTKEFLEGVCELARVAGRIISGRKRRAKRGFPGPGAAAKNAQWELQKEEREVKECVRIWNEEMARLKAAMGKAVPELSDQPWRGTGFGDQCKLCCLGKDEVLGLLKEQKDRLGWWDSAWGGHGGCRGFWERHAKSFKIR